MCIRDRYMDIETVKELDHVFGDIEELQKFRCLMMQYECAMLEVKTKLDVLNTELSVPVSYTHLKCGRILNIFLPRVRK